MDAQILGVLLAGLASLVIGGAWYAAFGRQVAALRPASGGSVQPGPATFAVELVRCLLVATVVAGLVSALEITAAGTGLALGLALWLGFPVVLLTGSVVWERVPWRLAALHAGDWLVKLLVVALIVTALQ